ncbi:MAG: glycosyltransferase family 4 protein [Symploca sp. SIO3E6]|nr:glycosyltransferase family 4 protein [Caldora sp. SIO3E6]
MPKNVAYLAPEIPSLSGTFVYTEILALQARGLNVIPISVHYPIALAKESEIEELLEKTIFLYSQHWISTLKDNLSFLFKYPKCYLATLFTVFSDIFKIGLTNSAALKLLYQFLQASKIAKILETYSCEHLHIHFAHVPTQLGMYASLLSKIPFTFTSHANDLFERGLLLREKVDRAKAAITISEYNRDFLAKQQTDTNKIKIVRCGVDTQKYEFIAKEKFNKVPVIGSLGRLVEKKGMDVFILALSQLYQNGLDVHVEIGGDGPLMEPLKELTAKHNLSSKINFKGAIAHDEVFSWLRSIDIFVLACKKDSNGDQDGIPVVLMEAMAIGIPVISTDISGIPELIQDGVSGFLAKPNDPDSLAQAISKFLDGSQHLSPMTESARQRMSKEFDKNVNIDRLLDTFN